MTTGICVFVLKMMIFKVVHCCLSTHLTAAINQLYHDCFKENQLPVTTLEHLVKEFCLLSLSLSKRSLSLLPQRLTINFINISK